MFVRIYSANETFKLAQLEKSTPAVSLRTIKLLSKLLSEKKGSRVGYKDYEILIANILRGISKLEGLTSSTVKHNVEMVGLSGSKHQIDVYWEFEIGPLTEKIVVQAKGGSKRVDLPTFMTFKGVLDDLEGRPRGIMVTRAGYDKGNIDLVAKSYNIEMFIVDEVPGIEVRQIGEEITVTLTHGRFSQKYDSIALARLMKSIVFDQITFKGKNTGSPISADELKNLIALAAVASKLKDSKISGFAFRPKEPLYMPIPGGYQLTLVEIFADIERKEISRNDFRMLSQYLMQTATGDKRYIVDNMFNVRKLD